jgi:NADH:ubiquinone oxidoreductase subunit 6 (subunit J)
MRSLLIAAFLANLALMLVSVFMLPDQVAIHFSGGGVPDAWASKWVHALILLLATVPLFVLFVSAARLTLGMPEKWISLPNKAYWLKAENRAELQARLGASMEQFGAVLFLFLFVVGLLTLDANLREPVRLNEALFLTLFAAYMLYVVYWLVKLLRDLKPPAHAR